MNFLLKAPNRHLKSWVLEFISHVLWHTLFHFLIIENLLLNHQKKTQYVSDIYLSRSLRRQNSENYLGFPHNSFLHQFQIKTLLLRVFPLYFLFVFHYFERWQQQNNLSLSNFENNFSEKIRRIFRFLWFSGNLDLTSSNSPLDWTSSQSP